MTLPLIKPQVEVIAPAADDPLKTSLKGTTIVILDDDPHVRAATAALLTHWECRVLVTNTPKAATTKVTQADYALVDYNLGREDSDGIAVIKSLRLIKPSLKAALITADRAANVEAACRDARITLLPKPLDPKLLLAWLTQT